MSEYLTHMPTDTLNKYGLTKTLLTRRETIYLKHVLKNLFVYGSEGELNNRLEMMNFKNLFQYMEFITNKLRMIYKLPREYQVEDTDELVKIKRESFFETVRLYKDLNPIFILDFDKTITNTKFHALYEFLTENQFTIYINSANPDKNVIENYLSKHNLEQPKQIYANKGKKRKIVNLKNLVYQNMSKILFYIDDEIEYLDYGNLLFMYCYEYTKDGKIKNRTIFQK